MTQVCRHFEFHEILSATENFDQSLVIGHGGFGKVYKGNISDGSTLVVAAIKRLDETSKQGATEFRAEIEMLSMLRHNHLVPLIGYCNYETEMILVYEYMPHGTLADHLHKLCTPLSWYQRLEICIGVSRGLDYLHTSTCSESDIIHRDIKSSNILLDECWTAKVSDFGLSKITPKSPQSTHVSTLVKGTFVYMDPNYFVTGKLTKKSDVYAFGVVLLEVLCRKRAVDNSFERGIVKWAQESIKQGRLKDIVDSGIRGEISSKCLKRFARIAKRCLDNHPKHRPTMDEVVLSLEHVLDLQEKTNKLSQSASKRAFDRMVDKLSFTARQSLGTNFGFLQPKKMNTVPYASYLVSHSSTSSIYGSYAAISPRGSGFTLAEIKAATNNFDNDRILGVSGSGKVYIGEIDGGRTKVAIKRGNPVSNQGVNEFRTEIELLSHNQHRNLISVVGYCDEDNEMIIVYDYMAHGSLREHLYNSQNQALEWNQRLKICIDAARGLDYLYSGLKHSIIQRDVKTSNILLDENWVAKVSYIGLSRTVTTLNYTDVSTVVNGESNVYSFGVVLFEILCARPSIDHTVEREQVSLAEWALNCHKNDILHQIVDPYLRGKITPECFKTVVEITIKCLAEYPIDRPTMGEVIWDLEYALALQERPLDGTSKDFDENLMDSISNTSSDSLSFTCEDSDDGFDTSPVKLC